LTAVQVLQGIVCYAALVLMLYLLVRAPRNVALRAVTIMIACWGVAYSLGNAASSGTTVLGLEPIMARLIQHLLLVVAAYSLLSFYLFSALDPEDGRRRVIREAVPLAAAAVIMTVATPFIPHGIRDAAAALASGKDGPVGETSVALLYVTVNLYMLYAFATTLRWTRRYARGAEPRLRRGLALASAGLAGIVVSLAVFVAANLLRWAGSALPKPLLFAGMYLVLFGIMVFLVGVAYPAAVMRLAALRVWWQHRAVYRRLAPLWTVLHDEFPEDALSRVPASPWRDTLSLRGMHRRYYRRVIECRDGLVRISPYLGPLGESAEATALAERLREGLRAHASGAPVPTRATPVAIPSDDGLDADVNELVALSVALGH
jgi:uncharacterized protein DUF6545